MKFAPAILLALSLGLWVFSSALSTSIGLAQPISRPATTRSAVEGTLRITSDIDIPAGTVYLLAIAAIDDPDQADASAELEEFPIFSARSLEIHLAPGLYRIIGAGLRLPNGFDPTVRLSLEWIDVDLADAARVHSGKTTTVRARVTMVPVPR